MKNNQAMLFVRRLAGRMNDPYYQGSAAELAFYFLFSLLPLLILMGQLLGFFDLSGNVLEELVFQYVEPEFARELGQYLSYRPSGTLSVILLVFALWSASQAQFSLIRISNYSYNHRLKGFRKGYLRERLKAAYTTLLMLFMMVFSLVILVYGQMLSELGIWYLRRFVEIRLEISSVWYLLRWPAGVAVIFPILCYNYHALPHIRLPLRKVVPGSIFASVGILVLTWVYSIYAVRFSSYALLYGGMATIISLLFWFYLMGSILVLGIQVNIVWDQLGVKLLRRRLREEEQRKEQLETRDKQQQ